MRGCSATNAPSGVASRTPRARRSATATGAARPGISPRSHATELQSLALWLSRSGTRQPYRLTVLPTPMLWHGSPLASVLPANSISVALRTRRGRRFCGMNGDARFNACKSQQELSDEEIDKLLSAQQVRPPSGSHASVRAARTAVGLFDTGCSPSSSVDAVCATRWIHRPRVCRPVDPLGRPFLTPSRVPSWIRRVYDTQLHTPHPSPTHPLLLLPFIAAWDLSCAGRKRRLQRIIGRFRIFG